MKENSLRIDAGVDTDEVVSFIFNKLTDEQVDQIGLNRVTAEGSGIAREAVTVGATLLLSAALTVVVLRLIERWMEERRQARALGLILEAGKSDPQAMKILADIEKKHAEAMSGYRLSAEFKLTPKEGLSGKF